VLIVDTGALVAAADSDDPDHPACLALLEDDDGPLITTAMVIAEAAYMLHRQLGPDAEAALYTSILDGTLNVEPLGTDDWERMRDLVVTYADLGLGGTDASLVTIAERLAATRLATLDHRHFHVVRPRHTDAFELVP
jgi:predicted nucleic acid-binding protein